MLIVLTRRIAKIGENVVLFTTHQDDRTFTFVGDHTCYHMDAEEEDSNEDILMVVIVDIDQVEVFASVVVDVDACDVVVDDNSVEVDHGGVASFLVILDTLPFHQ